MAYFFDFKVVVISIIVYLILLLISIKKERQNSALYSFLLYSGNFVWICIFYRGSYNCENFV